MMRELTHDRESIIQAYYLDSEYSTADVSCKLETVKEIDRGSFSRLVDELDLDHKQTIKSLYYDLSRYVHSNYRELRPTIAEGRNLGKSSLWIRI